MPKLTYDSFFDFSSEEGVKKALKVIRDLGKEYNKLITSSEQGSKKIKDAMDAIAKSVEKASSAKQKDNKATIEAAKAAEAQFKSMQSLNKAYQSNEASISKLKKEKDSFNEKSKETIRLEKQAVVLSDKIAQADSKQAAQVARLKIELQQKNKETALAAKEALGLVSIYDKESARLLLLSKRYKDYVVQGKEGTKIARQLKKDHDALRASIVRADQSVGQFNRHVGNYKRGLMGVASAGRQFLSAFGIVGGVTMIAYLIRDTFNLVKETERYNKALKQVTDSSSEYESELEFLTDISNKYGINLNVLTDSYTKFFVATKGTNLAGEETRRIFDAVSKSAAVMGLTTEDTEGALKALGQMISKGKVQAEELRGQLGDRLPGAFRIMADGLGVTTAELDKMLKDGKLLAEDVLPKFATQLEKTFGLDKVDKIDTLQASQTRLANEWIKFVKSVEDGSGAIATFAKGALNALSSVLGALNKSNEELASSFMTRFNVKTIDQFNSTMEEVGDNMNQQGREVAQLARQYIIADEGLRLYNEAQRQGFKTVEEFKTVQDEFIDKYGEEADNLDILNAVYDEYNTRLDLAKKKKVASTELEQIHIIKQLTDGIKELNDQRILATSVDDIIDIDRRLAARKEELATLEDYIDGVGKLNALRSIGADSLLSSDGADDALKNFDEMKDAIDSLDFDKMVFEAQSASDRIDAVIRNMTIAIESGEKDKLEAVRDAQSQIDEIRRQSFISESNRLRQLKNLSINTAANIFETIVQFRTLQVDQLQNQLDRELELVGDNADQRASVEKRYEDRIRDARIKQAKAQKLASIFAITVNTAQGVSAALALGPIGIPLAAIIGILGAAQLGIVASQPLPAFEKGTDSAPGGLAVVGEKGREMVIEPSGNSYLTGNTAELRDIPKGSQILTNSIVERMLNQKSLDSNIENIDRDIQNLEHVSQQKSAKAMASAIDFVVNASNEKLANMFNNEMKKIPRVQPIVTKNGSLVANIQTGSTIRKNVKLENTYGR